MAATTTIDPKWRNSVRPLGNSTEECPTDYLLSNFDAQSADLKREHELFIEQVLAKILRNNEEVRLHLTGRAGGPGANGGTLAERRVDSVVRLLRGLGIPPEPFIVSELPRRPLQPQSEPSAKPGPGEEQAVELRVLIPPRLRVVLKDADRVRNYALVIDVIRDALSPLAKRAGRELRIVQGHHEYGELELVFEAGDRGTRPPNETMIFGNGDGSVFVATCEELRVGGGPRLPSPTAHYIDPAKVDYVSAVVRVFDPDEPEFAKFVGNIAVHEIGHLIGLEHSTGLDSFMTETVRQLLSQGRSKTDMRRVLAGSMSFRSDHARRIVCAMRTGFYPGGASVKDHGEAPR